MYVKSTDIEEQINTEFREQISALPNELSDPIENMLNYIKKRAKCNDYEAVEIQNLMSEQSAQKQGYNYYCKYISGQSTPEEDRADYYISIRKSWDKFLDKFANMTIDERADALTLSINIDEIEKILNNSSPEKLEYITEKTEKEVQEIDKRANELNSKSTAYLTTHLNYTKKIADELESLSHEYEKKIMVSAKKYDLENSNNENYTNYIETASANDDGGLDPIDNVYDPDLYSNAVNVMNKLKNEGKPGKVLNGGETVTINRENPFGKGDLLQFTLFEEGAPDKNPIYRYAQVHHLESKEDKTNPETGEIDDQAVRNAIVKSLEIEAWDSKGNTITSGNINTIRFKECEYATIPIFRYYKDVDADEKWLLPSEYDYPSHIIKFDNSADVMDSDGKLYPDTLHSIYIGGCSGIEKKLERTPRPKVELLVTSCTNMASGALATFLGAVGVYIGYKAMKTASIGSPFKIAGVTIGGAVGIPLIISGVASIISGVTLIGLGIYGAVEYSKEVDSAEKIHKDIQVHNTKPFDALPLIMKGWVDYTDEYGITKGFYGFSCESGTISVANNPLKFKKYEKGKEDKRKISTDEKGDEEAKFYEISYDGHASRFGKTERIRSPRIRTNHDSLTKQNLYHDKITVKLEDTNIPQRENNELNVGDLSNEEVKMIEMLIKNVKGKKETDIQLVVYPDVEETKDVVVGYGYHGIMERIGLQTGGKDDKSINQANMFLKVKTKKNNKIDDGKKKVEYVAIAFQPAYQPDESNKEYEERKDHKLTVLRKIEKDDTWYQWKGNSWEKTKYQK